MDSEAVSVAPHIPKAHLKRTRAKSSASGVVNFQSYPPGRNFEIERLDPMSVLFKHIMSVDSAAASAAPHMPKACWRRTHTNSSASSAVNFELYPPDRNFGVPRLGRKNNVCQKVLCLLTLRPRPLLLAYPDNIARHLRASTWANHGIWGTVMNLMFD